MAKESSFDVVSSVDVQEVDNAFQQTSRELQQRYDLKQTGATIEFSKGDEVLTICAPSDFICSQVRDVLESKLARRKVDLAALRWDDPKPAGGSSVRQLARLVQGIDKDVAKKISKDIRDQKFKAKVTIEGDKLRVSSASKDTLQTVIQFLKDSDYAQPLQYVNYR